MSRSLLALPCMREVPQLLHLLRPCLPPPPPWHCELNRLRKLYRPLAARMLLHLALPTRCQQGKVPRCFMMRGPLQVHLVRLTRRRWLLSGPQTQEQQQLRQRLLRQRLLRQPLVLLMTSATSRPLRSSLGCRYDVTWQAGLERRQRLVIAVLL
jgi:hypothetical protein